MDIRGTCFELIFTFFKLSKKEKIYNLTTISYILGPIKILVKFYELAKQVIHGQSREDTNEIS